MKLSRVEGVFGPPMEMMACGGAVVVGRVIGYDEYIADGYNALVVDADDINAARDAVLTLSSDKCLRDTLIVNGRVTAQKWKWDESIDLLERYFVKLLSSPECRADYGKRAEHDLSLSHAYALLSKNADIDQIVTDQVTHAYIPSHALILGQYLVSKPSFWKISAFIRWFIPFDSRELRPHRPGRPPATDPLHGSQGRRNAILPSL